VSVLHQNFNKFPVINETVKINVCLQSAKKALCEYYVENLYDNETHGIDTPRCIAMQKKIIKQYAPLIKQRHNARHENNQILISYSLL
jgi:hypothetical protein